MVKVGKQAANYQPTWSPLINCHYCVHIQLHGEGMATCELVLGYVDREHVCDLYAGKPRFQAELSAS